ncbi:MAG: hypothetical protein K9H16_08970, partial [Bacteroidales bacterium]|nr:hypothetical protein [Bacteroidales bacterium]
MKSLISTFSKYTFLSICFTIIISIFSFHSTNAQNFVNKGIGSFEKISGDGLPPGWEYLPNTGNPHGLIIVLGANPRINDIPINDGDYIGAFYEDDFGALKCGGADVWNGTENIIFPVFGDNPDTPEKDGFSYNETMRFRIYYQNNQKDYEVTQIAWDPNYYGTNKWNPLGVSSAIDVLCTVGFDAYATVSENPVCLGQTINLDAQVFIETTGNYSYSWLSDPIGLNSNLASISHTPAESTTYYLEVSDGLDISTHQQHVFVFENPQVYAPDTINICKNQTAQLSAEVINYSGVIWSTEGDGTFFNPGSLNAIYHPGNADKANGSARLSIKAFPKSPCLNDATDTTLIVLKSPAEITLPATLEFCELEEMMVEAEASLFSAVLWASSGDGTFSNPDSLLTQYFPGPSDLSINEFLLSATAFSISPCQVSVSDQVFVSTYNGPTLSAPTSRTVCETSSVNLNSVAFNYTSSLWTTAGDGTFDNPQLLNTIYHPGTGDIETGGNIVTVHAFGNGICQEYSVSKNIQIILKVLPTADAGNDQPVCIGGTVNLSGTATNQSYLTWSSSGDGYFDNIYSPSPVYYPGSIDFSSQTFSLFLSAFANYPCTLPSVDTVEIEVLPEPEVEIGLNTASVCFGANYYFEQTVAYNYSTLNWFTINGTGTFDDNSNLNPIYFPDPGHDYSLGSVIVGISVQSLEPCTSVADDFMTLVMQA